MIKLGVNVDHIATIRQARQGVEPDPVQAAVLAELAGADGITIHLREDRRHINDRDVRVIKEVARTKLNLEMAATDEMVKIALSTKPDQATLVPEKRQELTTEGGLDCVGLMSALQTVVNLLQGGEIEVSLFIDPDLEQVKAASRLRADGVEIHTGSYANAWPDGDWADELDKIRNACNYAAKLKLKVYAGHGLNYRNIKPLLAIKDISEVNIGHSIIARASLVGISRAVGEMKSLLG